MPSHTRHRLEARRAARRQRDRHRHRRMLAGIGVAVAAGVVLLGIVALVVVLGTGSGSEDGPLADPVPSPDLGTGGRPPDIEIASAAEIPIQLPVDPDRLTAIAFHPVSDPALVPMDPSGEVDYETSPRGDRSGPDTAAVDVGAPAGTAVYAPVDGTIAAVSDYVLSGKVEGYEVAIEPELAARQLVVRVTHLDPHDGSPPEVGSAVTAGQTIIGTVRDFSGVTEQEISQFTSDAGNHVAIEVIRTGTDLAP